MRVRSSRAMLVTSCKGGIGKSTVAANLAAALTAEGKNILLIDCDFGSRCLDLILGCENDVIYDVTDVALDRIQPIKAVINIPVSNGTTVIGTIKFVAAPAIYENELTPVLFKSAVEKLAAATSPDLILLDTSGGMSSIELCASSASNALIVTSHQPAAIRAAERTGNKLASLGVKESRLVINCFDFSGTIKGERTGIAQIIDSSHLMIIGVVPYDYNLELAQESATLITEMQQSNCAAAFKNIASRLTGIPVPLFKGFKNAPIKKLQQK